MAHNKPALQECAWLWRLLLYVHTYMFLYNIYAAPGEDRRARVGQGQWNTRQVREAAADRAAEMEAAMEAAMAAIRDGQMQKGLNLLHTDGLATLQCTEQRVDGDGECGCEGCSNLRQVTYRCVHTIVVATAFARLVSLPSPLPSPPPMDG